MESTLSVSTYFKLIEVNKGVWGAFVNDGSGALGNSGVVDLGDSLLIFDTFLNPLAAKDLRRMAEGLTGKKVRYVINSHWHGDHIYGNQAFKDCIIIATETTKKIMEERCVIADVASAKEAYSAYLSNQQKLIESEENEKLKEALIDDYHDKEAFLSILDSVDLKLPSITFDEKLVIHGSSRTVEIHCFGGGHSESDAIMYLPGEKIAFVGDLVPIEVHPYIGSGNVDEWLEILKKLKAMEIDTIVAGHGLTGTSNDIQRTYDYLIDVVQVAKEIKEGLRPNKNKYNEIPNNYVDWRYPHLFEWNIDHLLLKK